MRKTSLDLRREIIDVGGIQNLIELRKKRKQKKREALAAAQEPPPEPEEIVSVLGRPSLWAGESREARITWTTLHDWTLTLQTGPVDEETFLKAAVEGKMKVIEKFLADGGSADTCDEVKSTPLHLHLPSSPCPFVGLFESSHGRFLGGLGGTQNRMLSSSPKNLPKSFLDFSPAVNHLQSNLLHMFL